MDAILERCAGLDVHQETVVACVLHGPLDKKPYNELGKDYLNSKEQHANYLVKQLQELGYEITIQNTQTA